MWFWMGSAFDRFRPTHRPKWVTSHNPNLPDLKRRGLGQLEFKFLWLIEGQLQKTRFDLHFYGRLKYIKPLRKRASTLLPKYPTEALLSDRGYICCGWSAEFWQSFSGGSDDSTQIKICIQLLLLAYIRGGEAAGASAPPFGSKNWDFSLNCQNLGFFLAIFCTFWSKVA